MRRSKHDAEKTKHLLIQAACEVFYREGVARATLEQIAQEAGLTRGALYWHFNSKTDILDALFQEIMPSMQEFQQHLQPLDAQSYWDYVTKYFVNFFALIGQDERLRKFCTLMHLKCELTERNAQVVAVLSRYRAMWDEHIIHVVGKAVEVGALSANTDIKKTAWLLRSFLTGMMVAYLGDIEYQVGDEHEVSPLQPLEHLFHTLQHSPILKQEM